MQPSRGPHFILLQGLVNKIGHLKKNQIRSKMYFKMYRDRRAIKVKGLEFQSHRLQTRPDTGEAGEGRATRAALYPGPGTASHTVTTSGRNDRGHAARAGCGRRHLPHTRTGPDPSGRHLSPSTPRPEPRPCSRPSPARNAFEDRVTKSRSAGDRARTGAATFISASPNQPLSSKDLVKELGQKIHAQPEAAS